MRRLIVLRHAKSDWDAGVSSDHARPLNDRGRQEAPIVGRMIAELKWTPDWVLSSDSTRTRQTVELASAHFRDAHVVFTRDLYHAGIDEVRAAVKQVPAEVTTLMLVGHNPGWEGMVTELAGEHVEMKTAYAALLEGEAASFVELVGPGSDVSLVKVVKPR